MVKVQNDDEILSTVSTPWVAPTNVTDDRQAADRRIDDSEDPNVT